MNLSILLGYLRGDVILLRIRHIIATIGVVLQSYGTDSGSSLMNRPVEDLREMLLVITRSLVDHPDNISVNPVSEGETVTFWVYAHPKDTGKLIGVNGRIARALRVILHANAVKLQLRLALNIGSVEADQSENSIEAG